MATGGSNGHRRPARGGGNPARQRGSMAVAMLLMLLALISILGLVEVGYLYWGKRETQKVADLAALSGVQQLQTCASDNSDNAAARGNAATDNNFTGTLAIQCGHWDPTQAGDDPAHPDQHFVASASPVNAVRVTATMPLTPIFGITNYSGVSSTAVATATDPIAAFSVGSGLLGVDPSSPLGNLLSSALGTQLGLNLLTYNGIAGVDVSLLGIIKNLKGPDGSPIEVGTVNGVLSAPITVGGFLNAYVQALEGNPQTASVGVAFAQQVANIPVQLSQVLLNLGDVLNVNANTVDPTAALNTDINALDILNAVILAADSKNAVAIPAVSVNVGGVASVNLMLSIVEPPQIGIGGVGTTAHSADVRLAADITALSALSLVGEPLADLSVALEVASSDGTITNIACGVPNGNGVTNDVTINVIPGVANVGIANYQYLAQAFQNTSQTWSSILGAAGSNETTGWDHIVNVLNLIRIDVFTNAQLTATPPFSYTFQSDPSTPVADQSGMTYPSSLDANPSTESGLLISSLLNSNIQVRIPLILGLGINVGNVLSGLGPLLNTLLDPVLEALVDPLLQVAGVEIGTAQVNLRAVNCNAGPRLVY